MNPIHFHANGKLLLSGEYFVLDGAKAIGLPCKLGQHLSIQPIRGSSEMVWNSKLADGSSWFQCTFQKPGLTIKTTSDQTIVETLKNILLQARILNSNFLENDAAVSIETRLEFPRLWGLGTSSTLIYTIAKWSAVDPFELSKKTLGGSGYDIACAGSDKPILYQILNNKPKVESFDFIPPFADQLYFIYLGKKQNSREGIQQYRTKGKPTSNLLNEVSNLSNAFIEAKTLLAFQKAITQHEHLISSYIGMPKVSDLYFSDFNGSLKSLGAWGGDFILAATDMDHQTTKEYFNKKGFEVFLRYNDIVRGEE